MHKADGSEMQYYDKTIDIPEFFVVDVGNVNVIFMVVFAASPDAIKTWDSTHAHNNFELQCMVENSAERLVDSSRKYTLHNGDLMLLPPHMLHKSCTHPSLFGCYCINFSIIPPSAEMENQMKQPSFYESLFGSVDRELIFQNSEIHHCIEKIFESEEYHPDPISSTRIRAYLSILFEEIAAYLNTLFPQSASSKRQPPTQYQINALRKWLIDAYVSSYYMCRNHIDNISYLLNLSPRQAGRTVLALTNSNLQELILEQRMSVAYETIRHSTLPLNQIAEMIGYSTYSGFYTAFCKYYGYSPEKLREGASGSDTR